MPAFITISYCMAENYQIHRHSENHLSSSAFIQDVVIGMADGLTVPFALAAGISGAVHTNTLVIAAGLAEIAAGSIAMGLGGFLAGQTEAEHYESELRREYDEIERVPEIEMQEIRDVFAGYGLSEHSQNEIALELSKNKDNWANFMMKYELGLEKPAENRARNSALTIGISYIVGGIVPLFPYFLTDSPVTGLRYSAIVTVCCLFIFGYLKAILTGQPPIWGATKITAIGALAASAAFLIAKMIT